MVLKYGNIMKKFKLGDVVYIPVRIQAVFIEPGIINAKDGYYTVVLPELLEFRFPQGSTPMAVVNVDRDCIIV